jgi:hypothetical protein
MCRLSVVFCVCAILIGSTDFVWAGGCADDIRDLRKAAQLAHRLTPETISRAHTYADLMFAAALAQAEALDALGHEADCLLAARRAKQTSEIQ